MKKLTLFSLALGVWWMGLGCEPAAEDLAAVAEQALDPEYGKPMLEKPETDPKDDSVQGSAGPSSSADQSDTVVWAALNNWEDTDTEAARQAGMSWEANSGLDWNQKYALWVDSFERTEVHGSTSAETFIFRNPQGKELPAPQLECAEVAIFLRAAFASWYNLPFYMAAWTPEGMVYFGHFGIRTKDGVWKNMPRFKTRYADHSGLDAATALAEWPQDDSLRSRYLTTLKDDANEFLGEGAYSGAYFDEMFLNKRTGHFLLLLLTYTGSIHLVAPSNTYNVAAASVREGDVLLHRWQKKGIGHTMLVGAVTELPADRMEVELTSGSMPRRQPRWESTSSSRWQFLSKKAGGPGLNYDGDSYVSMGGGLKRWRVAKLSGSRYYNTVPASDASVFISTSDETNLMGRVADFEALLGDMTPEEVTEALVAKIESKREHLADKPASCSARIAREEAFTELYKHLEEHEGLTVREVDEQYRTLSDYVFAELVYDQSRTCCWNKSTADMHQAIMLWAEESVAAAQAEGACVAPPVFKVVDDGYADFSAYARSVGLEWVQWSADESCPQSGVTDDVEAEHSWTPFCEIADSLSSAEN